MMNRPIIAITVVLAAWTGGFRGHADAQEPKPDDRAWIVGTWRSFKLDYGDFGEWKGAVQLELAATSPDKIDLYLISSDGKRSRAADTQPSIMDDKTLFFGPIGSGLLFEYRRPSNDALILDLKATGTGIHAELRREGQICWTPQRFAGNDLKQLACRRLVW